MANTENRSLPRNASSTAEHEHGWRVESCHATSAGELSYVRCGECGTRRVDLQEPSHLTPVPISTELRPLSDRPAAVAAAEDR